MQKIKIDIPEIRLDLGCGKYKKEGFVGMDREDFGQEIVWDIKNGIPLPDDSVSEINSTHFIEHLDCNDIFIMYSEILRVCKKDAKIYLRCPIDTHETAQYPCHLSLWNENRFIGLTDNGELSLINIDKNSSEIWAELKRV